MKTGLRRCRRALRKLVGSGFTRQGRKPDLELNYWRGYIAQADTASEAAYYQKFITDMGAINDPAFFDGKIVLDIGCGPMGSLTWMTGARARIGLDPLAADYAEFGIAQHDMVYVCCGAETMPFPSGYVDVVISMNSLDHVDDFYAVCLQIRRVLKPGGHFVGSLNLNEPPSKCEPWMLTEDLLHKHLFEGWEREFYKVRPRISQDGPFAPYRYFYEDCPPGLLDAEGPQALWCRFRKPG